MHQYFNKNNGLKLLKVIRIMTSNNGRSDLQTSLMFERQATLPNADDQVLSTSIITPYLGIQALLSQQHTNSRESIFV